MLSRQSTERQTRIDRLQQRVQQLQTQKPEGLRAQRAQEGCCRFRTACSSASSACSKAIRRACSGWNRGLRLNDPPLPLCRLRHAGDLPRTSAAMMPCKPKRRSWPERTAGLPAMPGGAVTAQRLWLGSARCSGPTPIPTSSNTRSGPTAYDPGYWAYAYDDFVDTVFWGTDSPYSAYARYPEPGAAFTDFERAHAASVSPQTLRQLCGDPDKGVTAWPIAEITRAVRPTPEQRALLDELKAAAAKAADVSKIPAPIPVRSRRPVACGR